ncbi:MULTISPECIES: reverse transcriptase family protein [Stutzerimonas stutzeri subgroup]|uniref:Retron reverse transcriptase n=1 Tax=Stutzerimonas stutzeri CCUG 29243 TaxID=1196835 RepID=I4CZ04_STUST|nr:MULTISPECIES: reverse transcriptase family protein [Stutzerimonas stutzeri subgroup]AFM35311.1 retron reverse transcriptase [Stutzerimonas stutzeri CCUG 29243]MCQ2038334.1 reverse transcriptase family protein [Stutzerimonas kunmingensis]
MAKDRPYYPNASISSIDVLAKCLGVSPKVMLSLAKNSSNSYTQFTVPSKGKDRVVYEPKLNLKKIQKRINSRIFEHVQFPPYLQGGIKDNLSPRDYVENSKFHAGSSVLVSLDIRNFYDNIKYDSVYDVFLYFFKFEPSVCTVLTDLVTLNGKVPQGACTSSYIANLVFHNHEYSLVSYFRSKGITYSRLLDDVTLSSSKEIPPQEIEEAISKVAEMFKRHKLRIHPKKKKIEVSSDTRSEYKVTGVWVGHGVPKLRRKERDYIRQLVYICELEYKKDPTAEDYHDLWNRASAQVAKMTRLDHSQASALRSRMSKLLPLYSPAKRKQVIIKAKTLLSRNKSDAKELGFIKMYNKTYHSLGILSRTDKPTSRYYKAALERKFSVEPIKQFWEN